MSPQNFTFMFYGFTVAWLIIIGYVISIALREKKLRQELDRVKRMVEENEQATADRAGGGVGQFDAEEDVGRCWSLRAGEDGRGCEEGSSKSGGKKRC